MLYAQNGAMDAEISQVKVCEKNNEERGRSQPNHRSRVRWVARKPRNAGGHCSSGEVDDAGTAGVAARARRSRGSGAVALQRRAAGAGRRGRGNPARVAAGVADLTSPAARCCRAAAGGLGRTVSEKRRRGAALAAGPGRASRGPGGPRVAAAKWGTAELGVAQKR